MSEENNVVEQEQLIKNNCTHKGKHFVGAYVDDELYNKFVTLLRGRGNVQISVWIRERMMEYVEQSVVQRSEQGKSF